MSCPLETFLRGASGQELHLDQERGASGQELHLDPEVRVKIKKHLAQLIDNNTRFVRIPLKSADIENNMSQLHQYLLHTGRPHIKRSVPLLKINCTNEVLRLIKYIVFADYDDKLSDYIGNVVMFTQVRTNREDQNPIMTASIAHIDLSGVNNIAWLLDPDGHTQDGPDMEAVDIYSYFLPPDHIDQCTFNTD